jgi:hypothetical protein
MPLIKQIELSHKGHVHKFSIWYTEKEKFFVKGGLNKDMEDRVIGLLKGPAQYEKYNTAETLEILREKLKRFVEIYWQAMESCTRVILFSAEFSDRVQKNYLVESRSMSFGEEKGEISYHESTSGYRNDVYKNPRIEGGNNYNNDLEISFNWLIADMVKGAEISIIEVMRNDAGEFVKCGTNFKIEKNNKDKYVILDYSIERETFFINLENQFKNMADKMASFIVQSDAAIATLIDTNQIALLPSE